MRAILIVGVVALLTALAGCTGDFRVKQTEPIRLQIDGESQETRVAAPDSGGGGMDAEEKSEFRIESPQEVEVVKVVVEVTKVEASPTPATNASADAAIILVIVEDRDDNRKLAEQRVEAREDAASVELNVDVKGRDNVVIVTQAVQGVADVNVAAQSGESTMGTSPAPTTTYA